MGFLLKVAGGVSGLVSIILIIVGICVLVVVLPNTLDEKLKERLPILNGSKAEELFIESPVPAFVKFYIFNITNKEQTINGEKAALHELGPYVFRQEKIKTILRRENDTVTYTEKTVYFFDEEMSNGELTDQINHVNMVSFAIMDYITAIQMFNSSAHEDTVSGEFVETHSVAEILFDGYSMLPYTGLEHNPNVVFLFCSFVPQCRNFAIQVNNSISAEFMVNTGSENINDIGKILMYDKEPVLTYWHGDSCNAIRGSDGKQFGPGVKEEDTLHVFSSDVCRSLRFKFDSKKVIEKIDALRFVIPKEVFADPNKNDENMCFCPRVNNTGPCPSKAGVFSVKECKKIRIAMSAPHFYMGEKEYVDNFFGLNPNKKDHQTFLDVEPITGTVIAAAKRLQINMMIEKGNATIVQNVKKSMYFPVLWLEEGAVIDEKTAKDFRSQVTNPYNGVKWGMVAVIAVAGVVLMFIVVIACFKKGK